MPSAPRNSLHGILSVVLLVSFLASSLAFFSFPSRANAATIVIFLTTTGANTWVVPSDWDSSNNTIGLIGAGGGGDTPASGATGQGGGGGGGAYSRASNVSLTPGDSVTYVVGAGGGVSTTGGDTFLCNVLNSAGSCDAITDTAVQVGAKGGTGASGTSPGVGGAAASGKPAAGGTRNSGGNGGAVGGSGGSGGGGAAGPHGNGAQGGPSVVTAGAGGGGANGGSVGGQGGFPGDLIDNLTPGNGGNGRTGTGGGTGGIPGGAGSNGGGGGGGGGVTGSNSAGNGGTGGQDAVWTQTSNSAPAGPAGGGGGGGPTASGTAGVGGTGGTYGGGGGGGGAKTGGSSAGGSGAHGIIVITYTQLALPPSVTTDAASSITIGGATLNGTITSTNGADPTQHGFAYGTNSTLSTVIATTTLGAHPGTGSFDDPASSLNPNTTYYFRAYATSPNGTGYGSIANFTTGAAFPPTVTTDAASNIKNNSASSSGTITSTGGGDATQTGFAYGTDPTLSAVIATTTLGPFSGTGTFGGTLGYLGTLNASTLYYYRAYATNAFGTGYGSIQSFTTLDAAPARRIRLFQGYKIKIHPGGRIIIYGQ